MGPLPLAPPEATDLGLAGELPRPDGGGYDTGADLTGLHATMLVYILTDA